MDKYQDAIECASYLLTLYDKLTKKQIAQYDYPWNMFLYAFYMLFMPFYPFNFL
jgi:hypothetical protein